MFVVIGRRPSPTASAAAGAAANASNVVNVFCARFNVILSLQQPAQMLRESLITSAVNLSFTWIIRKLYNNWWGAPLSLTLISRIAFTFSPLEPARHCAVVEGLKNYRSASVYASTCSAVRPNCLTLFKSPISADCIIVCLCLVNKPWGGAIYRSCAAVITHSRCHNISGRPPPSHLQRQLLCCQCCPIRSAEKIMQGVLHSYIFFVYLLFSYCWNAVSHASSCEFASFGQKPIQQFVWT